MKKSILLIAMILIGTSAHAQWWKRIKGNGNTITQTRQTANYDKVSVSGSFDVQLVRGEEGEITLKGEENLLKHIEVYVKNNVLILKVKDNINLSSSWNKTITIEVPVIEITGVKLSGSGDISTQTTLKATDFNAAVSGSGDISLAIEATNLYVQISGSGDINLSGSADDLTVKVSGSGDVNAYDVAAQDATVTVSGSADVTLTVKGTLNAKVSGSGDIQYKGNPKKVVSKVSGSGDVNGY
ncbi:DUF2807 domain-containing protein [Flavobacteriaceae bacterium]|nr:DUF2807 domain-containing protein [Flavobacteriaceae bacterium]